VKHCRPVSIQSVIVERWPIEAMQSALLAWELNGEPLPLAHGGPLRLIVPGYSGVNNVKYVKRLAFTAAQTRRHPVDRLSLVTF
jgi:sulfite dehydrogenase